MKSWNAMRTLFRFHLKGLLILSTHSNNCGICLEYFYGTCMYLYSKRKPKVDFLREKWILTLRYGTQDILASDWSSHSWQWLRCVIAIMTFLSLQISLLVLPWTVHCSPSTTALGGWKECQKGLICDSLTKPWSTTTMIVQILKVYRKSSCRNITVIHYVSFFSLFFLLDTFFLQFFFPFRS